MLKTQIIWREILYQNIEKKVKQFTQKELAQRFSCSLNLVFYALKIPRQMKIVEVTGRNFKLINREKFLLFWATHRNLKKDIIYQTCVNLPIKEIEASMPSEIIYGAYSAYTQYFNGAPADYDKIYIYSEEKNLGKLKKRFPLAKGYSNLTILRADKFLKDYGEITPLCQTFVDLWNVEEWYAQEFLNALKEKIII